MRRVGVAWVCLAAAIVAGPGCSIRKMAVGGLADSLAAGGTTFASDDDIELIRDAVPFSLKTIESLLVEVPEHPGLLLSACSGFTQYAYAFVQLDAEILEPTDFERAQEQRARARRLYLRGRDYCLRRLELGHRGVRDALQRDPATAVSGATRADVPALYWTGAAWGSAIAIGLDQPELVADLPAVRALMERALALDEAWDRGAIHAAMISIDAVPESAGGSAERARRHFARAVELSSGLAAGPYVTLAASVAVAAQDRAEFERLLDAALAIDPDKDPPTRLANLVAQKRARFLRAQVDALFVEGESR